VSALPHLSPISARDLAELTIEAVGLEGLDANDVDLNGPIYGDGLGLDSLDILEIALAIQQRYGVKLKADDPDNEAVFSSLQCLADHINSVRCPKG